MEEWERESINMSFSRPGEWNVMDITDSEIQKKFLGEFPIKIWSIAFV